MIFVRLRFSTRRERTGWTKQFYQELCRAAERPLSLASVLQAVAAMQFR